MKQSEFPIWVEYNNTIISVYYSDENKGYLQTVDDTTVIPKSAIKRIRLDDNRINRFRIIPSLSETDKPEGEEAIDCFLEETLEYQGKQYIVLKLLREGKMTYLDELQKYLIKQDEIIVDY